VDWYVFMDTLQVDANQILDFMYFAGSQVKPGNNARPPQPIQNRDLRFFA
jgi:carbonic anhydrase